MLQNHNIEKLHDLRLEGMVQALEEQRRQNDIIDLDFEERLGMLIQRQWAWKESRGLAARLKYAQFKIQCALEDIDYRLPRGLKRAQIEQLRASQWVKENRSCLITGATGTSKTFVACALGHHGCLLGHRALYYYVPKFFRDLQIARADGSLCQLLKKLARVALLVIDDLGIASVTVQQYRDLLEVLDDRHGNGATLITSQLPVEEWHRIIGDATVADAIMDRLAHNAYRIALEGESVRKLKGRAGTKENPSDKKGSGTS
jgi:DNA replication protein DnaC